VNAMKDLTKRKR